MMRSWTTLLLVAAYLGQMTLGCAPALAREAEGAPDLQVQGHAHAYQDLVAQMQSARATQGPRLHPLDDFFLLSQSVHPKPGRVTAVPWWGLDLQVVSNGHVKPKQVLKVNDNSHFQARSSQQAVVQCADECLFHLSYRGRVLNQFHIPVHAVALFGPYVVFTTSDSYDSRTKMQTLHFVDLQSFNSLVGNETLPVFQIPVSLERPLHTMVIDQDQFVLNQGEATLNAEHFRDLSAIQEKVFNLTANLSNPETYAGATNLLEAVDSILERNQSEDADQLLQVAGVASATQVMSRLSTQLQTQLDGQQQLAQLSQKTGAQFLEELQQTAGFRQSLTAMGKRLRTGASLRARLDLLVNQMITPRVRSSSRLRQTLTVVAAGARRALGERAADIITDMSQRPYMTTGMVAAASVAVTYPEAYTWFAYQGLDVGHQVMTALTQLLAGFGKIGWHATAATARGFLDPVHSLGKAYVDDGNWYRTVIGIGGLIGTYATFLGTEHLGVNLVRLYADLKQWDWSQYSAKMGRWGRFRQAFIDRQNQAQQKYFASLSEAEAFRQQVRTTEWTEDDHRRAAQLIRQKQAMNGDVEALVDLALDEFKDLTSEQVQASVLMAFQRQRPADVALLRRLEVMTHPQVYRELLSGQSEELEMMAVADVDQAVAQLENEIGQLPQQLEEVVPQPRPAGQIQSLMGAVRHLLFSNAMFTNTIGFNAKVWNTYSGWRYCSMGWGYLPVCKVKIPFVKVKPVAFASRLLFPKFFERAVLSRDKQTVLPTELNGGTRPLWDHLLSQSTLAAAPEQLQALERFENQIIDVEDQIMATCLKKALTALTQFSADQEDLQKLLSAGGVKSITSEQISQLDRTNKVFVRAYFESLYNSAMAIALKTYLDGQSGELLESSLLKQVQQLQPQNIELLRRLESVAAQKSTEVSEATLGELKQMVLAVQLDQPQAQIVVTPEQVDGVVRQAMTETDHFAKATDFAKSWTHIMQATLQNVKFELASDLDPTQNGSMDRYATANAKLKNPLALARAVRAEIAKLQITIPLDLALEFLMLAGVDGGIMKPVQNEMFGPNSIFYLSQFSFYGGFMTNLVMGTLADAWSKLQADARHDDLNNFGKIPKGADAKLNFWQYFLKQTFAHPDNSYVKNLLYDWKLTWYNIPAALINLALFNFASLGRFDFDYYVSGYLAIYLMPYGSISSRFSQGFELASYHVAAGIPEELLPHPLVQEYISREIQKKRNRFTLGNDIYLTVIGGVMSNIETLPVDPYGPRAFLRLLFGGYTPTELVVNGANEAAHAVAGTPVLGTVAEHAAKTCELFLTNRATDLVKLAK